MPSSSAPCLLYAITLSELGGAQSHLLSLMEYFRTNWNVHLMTSTEGPLTEMARDLGITLHLLPNMGRSISPLDDVKVALECVSLIKHIQPRLIHLHSSKAGLIGRIAAARIGAPVIFTAHGWGFKPRVPLRRRALVWASEFLTAPLAKRLICVSQYDLDLAVRYRVGNRKSRVLIRNGIKNTTGLAIPETQPVRIIMTARFQEPKQQQLLLRSFAALECADEVKLTFVGAGPQMDDAVKLARELGFMNSVEFLGDRLDVPELLSGAQIFVLLSNYEGLPVSVLEAMRAGLPVIATNVGGVSEEVEHGVTGFLVSPGDLGSVVAGLTTLVHNPSLRRQMGKEGRRKFLTEFTIEQMLAQTEAVYVSVSSERG